jgi:ppGpp synthetase/RelA/SpoT-type nucleotidyltranferase
VSAPTAESSRQRFVDELPALEDAREKLQAELEKFSAELGVLAVVETRVKSLASFVKKCHLKRSTYTDLWAQVDDKVGGRIIVNSLRDLRRIREALEDPHQPLGFFGHKDKAADTKTDQLAYRGFHAQMWVPDALTSGGERIEAEVQLRTRAQDLSTATEHKLLYKGVVKPGEHAERRLLRLSVLSEIFDDEVEAVMDDLAADPAYADALLVQVAESEYLRFVGQPGSEELSLEVMGYLTSALGDKDASAYAGELRSFVQANTDKLAELFADYGAFSDYAGEFSHFLFSQPESLIVLHLAEHKGTLLAAAVVGSEIETAVSTLAGAWGSPLPEVE